MALGAAGAVRGLVLAAGACAPSRGRRRRRPTPRCGCASSRPTSPSTTNGTPSKRVAWFSRHLELSRPRRTTRRRRWWSGPRAPCPTTSSGEPEVRAYLAPVRARRAARCWSAATATSSTATRRSRTTACSSLDGAGARSRARYDKVDLVPFGEFLPFRRAAGPSRPAQADRRARSTSRPARAGSPCRWPGLPPASPLICYEAAFPGEATAPSGRARRGWSTSPTTPGSAAARGPYQHLAMARMRAVEEGLPLVRAANTGISVVTDAYGRVRARLGARTRPA